MNNFGQLWDVAHLPGEADLARVSIIPNTADFISDVRILDLRPRGSHSGFQSDIFFHGLQHLNK